MYNSCVLRCGVFNFYWYEIKRLGRKTLGTIYQNRLSHKIIPHFSIYNEVISLIYIESLVIPKQYNRFGAQFFVDLSHSVQVHSII